jgi:phosphinothricin acetyltransferase
VADTPPAIRHANPDDLPRITAIFNTVIEDSHVSFEEQPRALAVWKEILASKSEDGPHQLLVAVDDGEVVGLAYSSPWRSKSGYRLTVETTIVLDPDHTGGGIGTALLSALLESVARAGAHRAVAVVAVPNEASMRLHEKLGFERVGLLDEVGFKNGRFWSTELLQKRL